MLRPQQVTQAHHLAVAFLAQRSLVNTLLTTRSFERFLPSWYNIFRLAEDTLDFDRANGYEKMVIYVRASNSGASALYPKASVDRVRSVA